MKTSRVAYLAPDVCQRIDDLRRQRLCVSEICDRLGITKSSEMNAVSVFCADPSLRRFQVGIESGPHSSPHRIRTGNWA